MLSLAQLLILSFVVWLSTALICYAVLSHRAKRREADRVIARQHEPTWPTTPRRPPRP